MEPVFDERIHDILADAFYSSTTVKNFNVVPSDKGGYELHIRATDDKSAVIPFDGTLKNFESRVHGFTHLAEMNSKLYGHCMKFFTDDLSSKSLEVMKHSNNLEDIRSHVVIREESLDLRNFKSDKPPFRRMIYASDEFSSNQVMEQLYCLASYPESVADGLFYVFPEKNEYSCYDCVYRPDTKINFSYTTRDNVRRTFSFQVSDMKSESMFDDFPQFTSQVRNDFSYGNPDFDFNLCYESIYHKYQHDKEFYKDSPLYRDVEISKHRSVEKDMSREIPEIVIERNELQRPSRNRTI